MVEVFWQIPVAIMSLSILNFAAEIFSKNRGIFSCYIQYTKHTKARIYPTILEFVSKTSVTMLSAISQFEPAFFFVSCILSLRIRFLWLRMWFCWSNTLLLRLESRLLWTYFEFNWRVMWKTSIYVATAQFELCFRSNW